MRIQSPARFIILALIILVAAAVANIMLIGASGAWANNAPLTNHIIYADQSANGANNGSSWADAFTDLQDGLAAASAGDEIWVAAGLYKPTSDPTHLTATFQLKNGVALYGGFAGVETEREERDWQANLTVLSGDIDNNDLTDLAGVVTATANITGANSYHVVTSSGNDSSAILDGFIVTAGKATVAGPHNMGGGFLNLSSSPTLANLIFSGNIATNGGAMHSSNNSSPTLTNVVFSGNSAAVGGGMYNVNNSNPMLLNAIFRNNSATGNGGGMHNVNGSSPTLTNVVFSGNSAPQGGGLDNILNSSPNLTNVSVSGNNGGGLRSHNNSHPTVQNSIFWNNAGGSIGNSTGSVPIIRYSLVQGCNPGGIWNPLCGTNGGNNLADGDPLFVSGPDPVHAPTSAGNLRLQAGSPAIDAGNNAAVSGVPTDLDGNPRIIGPAVDLGPYEGNAYLLAITIIGQGTVTAAPSGGAYPLGTLVTVTAAAHPGWSFAGWSGDLTGMDNPQSLTVDGNKAITATFANNPPVAHAGPDQTVLIGWEVVLDGRGSYDDDPNQALSYDWVQTGGPAVSLSGSSVVTPTFMAPTSPAVLTFTLTVTDNFGLASAPDNVVITVIEEEPITGLTAVNSSPTTLGQTTFFTATITEGSNVSYVWDFGDSHSTTGAMASHIYAAAGLYTATVTASNLQGSVQSTTVVTVTNIAPIANAGPDETTEVNQLVTLDGSGSIDPDGHWPLSYGWTQTGGPAVTLSSGTAVSPTFMTPASRTVLTFTLTVTDSYGLASAPDTVVTTIQQPAISISKQANVTTANVGQTITYTYAITNSGDTTLSQIYPVDDRLGPLFAAPISLEAGDTANQTLTYTVVESDLPGPLVNTVTVTGTSPLNSIVGDSDFAAVILSSQPAIYVLKEANGTSAGMNQVITYSYTIMNVGDVTLSNITAVDDQLGPVPLPTTTLPSLGVTSGVLTYIVTESDLPGPLVNSVVVTGTPAVGSPVTSMDTLSLALTIQPELDPHLTAYPQVARPGEVIVYTLTLTNGGDVTLTDLTAVASIPGSFVLPTSLAPGASASASYSYTVLVADLSGPMTNTVTITAVPPVGAALQVTAEVVVVIEPFYLHLPVVLQQHSATAGAAGLEQAGQARFVNRR